MNQLCLTFKNYGVHDSEESLSKLLEWCLEYCFANFVFNNIQDVDTRVAKLHHHNIPPLLYTLTTKNVLCFGIGL